MAAVESPTSVFLRPLGCLLLGISVSLSNLVKRVMLERFYLKMVTLTLKMEKKLSKLHITLLTDSINK